MDEELTPHLGVARDELEKALRTLRRLIKTRRPPEAQLTYEDRELVIRIGGATVSATAWGRWSGMARAPGLVLTNLDRSLPDMDPMPVSIRNGRLKIGRSSFACAWHDEVPEALEVPIDAGLLHLLRLPLEHEPEHIEAAGLGDVVARAEAKRDELIERAMRTLMPLEIGEKELLDCVDRKIRSGFPTLEDSSRRGPRGI